MNELSKGNKQKIGIVLTFAPETELLIVDEPTAGLDPFITKEYYNILHEQQEEMGTTVLLSSHLLGEVEEVAHRVGIIREGTIVEVDSVQNLKKMALKKMKIEFHTDLEVQQFTSTIPTGIVEDLRTDGKSIILTFSRENLIEIIGVLNQVGKVRDLDIKSPDLEDIFMKYYETSQSGAGSLKTRKIQNEEVD